MFMPEWRVIDGDALTRLRGLDAGSVQTCVTSPPYFGLRDYGNDGQIGLEPTPDEYVASLVEVFREVKRVLRDDGTLWLNLGDSYAGSPRGNAGDWSTSGLHGAATSERYRDTLNAGTATTADKSKLPGVKQKDLIGVPWMVAFALRADGWYLRSDVIWAKPNPMPESVTDRPTKAHEYLFLLSKKPTYYFDADAIREDFDGRHGGGVRDVGVRNVGGRTDGFTKAPDDWQPTAAGRNKRSVWTVATAPFPGAHFAVFPPKLIEPCVLAGSSERACGVCGAPWRRVTESVPDGRERHPISSDYIKGSGRGDTGMALAGTTQLVPEPKRTVGWEPSCDHQDDTGACVVLDPFAGAGTTGVVATRHGRGFIGIELNAEYAEMARLRIRDDQPLMNYLSEAA